MKSYLEQVREWYQLFEQGIPDSGSRPSLTNDLIAPRLNLKMDLIFEEFQELVTAVYGEAAGEELLSVWPKVKELDSQERDVVEAADALADLSYVIAGMALEANIPLDEVFEHVHQSNISKLGEDGKALLSDGVTPAPDGEIKPLGKILKGPNYWEPDIAAILFDRDEKDSK